MSASATLDPGGRTVTAPAPEQLPALNRLLARAWEHSAFYQGKWRAAGLTPGPVKSLAELEKFPCVRRAELERDQAQHPPLGTGLTVPFADCHRLQRSSGTTRSPMFWADDPASWESVVRASRALWQLAGVKRPDRIFLAMSYGAASGPWIMYGGAEQLGCLCFTMGRANLAEQIALVQRFAPTVLASKPPDLLALALAAETAGLSPASLGVRKLICGGGPGGHVPETRRELERRWGAECFDRYGMTEAGSIAGECAAHCGGLHLLESELIAEVLDPEADRPPADACRGELVLTHLHRTALPLIRYRTGDRVRLDRSRRCPCGNPAALLVGGVQRAWPSTPSD